MYTHTYSFLPQVFTKSEAKLKGQGRNTPSHQTGVPECGLFCFQTTGITVSDLGSAGRALTLMKEKITLFQLTRAHTYPYRHHYTRKSKPGEKYSIMYPVQSSGSDQQMANLLRSQDVTNFLFFFLRQLYHMDTSY